MRHYACAILKREGKILLGQRAPHRKAYPLFWDVIGGRVEDGETLEDALHRELGEEIGIVPTSYVSLASVSTTGRRNAARRPTTCISSKPGPEANQR